MAKKPLIFSEIPVPTEDTKSLLQSILAIKENIETLTGEKGPGGWANQTYISTDTPTARLEGDRWYKPALMAGEKPVESIWRNGRWEILSGAGGGGGSGPQGPQGNPGPKGDPGTTYIGVVKPPDPVLPGQLWYFNDATTGGGMLYIDYFDGDTRQWVPAAVSSPGPQGEQGNPSTIPGPKGDPGTTYIGLTAPPDPVLPGQLWYYNDGTAPYGGLLFISYFDGNTTQWVPAAIAPPGKDGAPGTTAIGLTPPVLPIEGQLWYFTDAATGGGMLYIWYYDGNTWQWVPAAVSVKGDTGATGATGATGPTGSTGATGPAGTTFIGLSPPPTPTAGQLWYFNDAAASIGGGMLYISYFDGNTTQWVPAAVSVKGDTGTPGATGATGPTGPAGSTGATGAPGAPGTTSVGLTPPPAPLAGQLWYFTDAVTGGGMLYISYFDGNTTQWVPAAVSIKGDTGAAGATGATGATGAPGAVGATGATGATGAQGIQGIQGVPGTAGATGATGATGPAGTTAVGLTPPTLANGQLWYFTDAVTGGGMLYIGYFDGNTTQWVPAAVSIKGDTGAAGATGATGATGAPGAAGATGATGAQGIQGIPGNTGATGAPGATGATGAQGAQGIQGTQGIQGIPGNTGATGAAGATGATGPPGTTSIGLTPPASPAAGQLWYFTDAITGGAQLYIWYTDPNTSQWVPAAVSPGGTGGTSTSTSATPPTTPSPGQFWFNPNAATGGGALYIWYDDGVGAAQWVPASPTIGGGASGGGGGGGPPTGAAGGVLSGTYPNPGFAAYPSFAGGVTITQTDFPGVSFAATGGAVGQKNWSAFAYSDGNFYIEADTDDWSTAQTDFEFHRDGSLLIAGQFTAGSAILGNATGRPTTVIRGGNSAAGDGALLAFRNSGTDNMYIGNVSGVFGGAYSPNMGIMTQTGVSLAFFLGLTQTHAFGTDGSITHSGGLKFLTSNGGDFNQGMWSRSANYGTFFRAYSGSTYDLLLSNSPQNVSMVLTAADARFLFGGNTGFYMDGTTGVVQITATPSGATSTEAATAAWTRNYVQTEIGMLQQTIAAGAYSTVQGDAGGHVYHASGAGAALYTIPNNATVAYQIGTTITFANDSATAITIAVQASDVLALSPAGTTGTRTLAQNGMATALKVTSTRWLISGTGLT